MNRKSYIGIFFLIIPFILTFYLLRESLSTLGGIGSNLLAALFGGLVGWLFYYVLNRINVFLKLGLLIIYILFAVFFYKYFEVNEGLSKKNRFKEQRNELILGEWFAQEEDVTMDVNIKNDTLILIYYPDSIIQIYTYKLIEGNLEMKGVNLDDELVWSFTFIEGNNKLIVNDEDFSFILSRK